LKEQEDGTLVYNHYVLAVIIELREDPLIKKIVEETKKDKIIQETLENLVDNENLTTDDRGLIYF
jgi:hypothetical protein